MTKSEIRNIFQKPIANNNFVYWILGIILSLVISHSSLAQEIPVNIKAQTLKFIEGTDLVVASGEVEVRLKNITINADFLQMDSASGVATAEGNVLLTTTGYSAAGQHLVYDSSSEVTCFSGYKSAFSTTKMKGNVYLTADQLIDKGSVRIGKTGSLTTCGNEDRHFYVVADKIELYPNDKLIGHNCTMYIGKMPGLWLPWLYYDLSSTQRRNWSFGHNNVEGDYIKSSWAYPLGILYLDYMQNKGWGLGTESLYTLAALGGGSLYLYTLNEADTGSPAWVSRIKHNKKIDKNTNLAINHEYKNMYLIPSGRVDQTSFGLHLGHKSKKRWNWRLNSLDNRLGYLQKYSTSFDYTKGNTSTGYSFNYDALKKSPKWVKLSQRLTHRQKLFNNKVSLSSRIDYSKNIASEGAIGDEILEPWLELRGQEKNFSWRYTQNWYFDPDGNAYTADSNRQYLLKQPEIEISPKSQYLYGFRLNSTLGYGQYREVRYVSQLGGIRDYTAQRVKLGLNTSRNYRLGWGTTMNVGAGLDQHVYSPGDQMFAYRENLGFNTSLFGFFKNNINYKRGMSDGNTPFLFDKLGTRYNNINEKMTLYYLSKVVFDVTGGYNNITSKWFNAMGNLRIRPNNQIYWNLRSGWDLENKRYKDFVNTLTYKPVSFFNTSLSSVSDLNNGDLKSASALYDLYLLHKQPNQWHWRFSQVLDRSSGQFRVRDIMLVKDLHCWELKYTYSDYRKEFSLVFSLKAMPDEPVGMSTGRGFYIESFEKRLKEITPKDTIRRY